MAGFNRISWNAGERQTMMFSATFPEEMQRLAADFMKDYIFMSVGRVGSSINLIIQHVEFIQPTEKNTVLVELINQVEVRPSTVSEPLLIERMAVFLGYKSRDGAQKKAGDYYNLGAAQKSRCRVLHVRSVYLGIHHA